MAEIKCPMCSKPNPEDLDVCQFCEARLKPLTDELSRSQPPIQPGAKPTPIDTGELEPVLPQWLREVRQKARDSAEDKEQDLAESDAVQTKKSVDLLAGLQSDTEDNEEIPDWLSGLRGEEGQAVIEEESSEDDQLSALESMLSEKTTDSLESGASSLPGWVANLGDSKVDEQAGEDELSAFLTDSTEEAPPQTELQPTAADLDFEITADIKADSAPEIDSDKEDLIVEGDLPGWLQGADEKPESQTGIELPAGTGVDELAQVAPTIEETPRTTTSESNTPDWLASLGEESTEASPAPDTAQPALEGASPDWMSSLGEESTEEASAHQEPVQPAVEGDMPDLMSSLGEESTGNVESQSPATESNLPEWMHSPGEENAEEITLQGETDQPLIEGDKPDWISSLEEESVTPQGSESASSAVFVEDESQPAFEGKTPDWLASLGDEGTDVTPQQEPIQATAEDETPDWLSSLDGRTAKAEQPADQSETPAFTTDEPSMQPDAQSAFVDDDGAPLSTEDVDAIFSMNIPDWLSDAGGKTDNGTPVVAEGTPAADLDPANLPSWVQAMRPVESVLSETDGEGLANQPLENSGPLAGLRGVLPAVSGVGPSSKPKAYTIKLQANDEQQSSAAMLEQILTEEIHPKPIVTQKVILSQRILRWLITGLLILVVGVTVDSGTHRIPIPVLSEPPLALQHIKEVLPQDAQILMIFDYEAALAGELEATATPLIDYMITLKHPRLCLISSTPTGTGLAERLMAKLQQDREFTRGENFINLGFLPGGGAGVLAFAESPANTKPLSTLGNNAWETPVLQDVSSLSNFATIILLTDDVETTRIWIEQTEKARGNTQLLVVSSAQSGPMILPYVQSGQVDGMVTGLDSSAPIEQVNSGRPGTVRRYWDAYGFGLLTAVAMISLGSLWSFVTGWQARRKEQGER